MADDDGYVKVKTRKEVEQRDEPALFFGFVFLLALAYGIGWKISGETPIGGAIGTGLMFVATMFSRAFREMIITLIFFFVGLGVLIGLLAWIFS